MKSPPTSEFQEILDFTASFLGEATPRALIVIGAARLEEEVKAIVAAVAPGFEAEHRSHAFRVDLLVSYGVLPDNAAGCLKKIGKIRNYFAHTSRDVSITDKKIKGDIDAIYACLDPLIPLSITSEDFFNKMVAKIPKGMPPATWVDNNWRRYQTTIIILLHHLVIVRYNLPVRASPIPLFQYTFQKSNRASERTIPSGHGPP
jgi:hypothetical protein